MEEKFLKIGVAFALATVVCAFPKPAAAGNFEASFGFSFSRTNYDPELSDRNFTWSRRWGASLGYHFTDRSEIEMAFQDVTDRTNITGFEDTEFHDRIYSLNWVQSITGKNSPVQPYVKAGVGQLNRDSNGTYGNGASPNPRVDSLTGVLGVGARIYLTRTFAIRAEGVSYLTGGNISTWDDNFNTSIGISLYF